MAKRLARELKAPDSKPIFKLTEFERTAGLGSVADGLVESFEDGLVGLIDRTKFQSARSREIRGKGFFELTASNLGAQSRAPRRAVVEQALYM